MITVNDQPLEVYLEEESKRETRRLIREVQTEQVKSKKKIVIRSRNRMPRKCYYTRIFTREEIEHLNFLERELPKLRWYLNQSLYKINRKKRRLK